MCTAYKHIAVSLGGILMLAGCDDEPVAPKPRAAAAVTAATIPTQAADRPFLYYQGEPRI